ncbi:MAG: hypothetical protein M3450_06205 [Actinomycetota bacterium]|nr:hypothetical protein [Actinomycetota bacterium]
MAEQEDRPVIVPGDDWPHRCILRQHAEYYPAPDAVPGTRGRCPDCGAALWDARNEAYGPHTVEQCAWNVATLERQDQEWGRPQPQFGPGAPALEW